MPSKADGPMPPEYEAFVATQIQAAYRGHSVRKQLELEAQAAAHIQREWRQSREASARAVRAGVVPSHGCRLRPWPLHKHPHRAHVFTHRFNPEHSADPTASPFPVPQRRRR